MSIPGYTPGYPPDGSTLGQTKSIIRNNIDGTFQTLSVNHYDNNDTNAGKHEIIQIPVAVDAAGSTGATEVLLENIVTTRGGSNNLGFIPPGKVISSNKVQMTRNEIPTFTGPNGYSWLPGGFLIQWGFVQFAAGENQGMVTFPVPFTSGGPQTVQLTINSVTPGNTVSSSTGSNFTMNVKGSANGMKVFWLAIGN